MSKKAFTLAETLLTLIIIGVIAALTIPSLIKSNNKTETEAKLKKVFSTISNAVNMSCTEFGNVKTWDFGDGTRTGMNSEKILKDIFGKYLFFSKYCGSAIDENCIASRKDWNGQTYTLNHGSNWTGGSWAKAILADGTSIAISANASNALSPRPNWAIITVDVNGLKAPNQLGKDIFFFELNPTTNKLEGAINDWTNSNINSWCKVKGSVEDANLGDGTTCSTRILRRSWQIDYW